MSPETIDMMQKGAAAAFTIALGFIAKSSRVRQIITTRKESRERSLRQLAMIPAIHAAVTEIGTRVALVEGRSWSHCQFDREDAIFEADAEGHWLRVNTALLAKTGCADAQLLGFEWLNLIDHADRVRVRAEWNDAVLDGRSFEQRCLVSTRYMVRTPMIIRALPSRRPCDLTVVGWNGRLWFDSDQPQRQDS